MAKKRVVRASTLTYIVLLRGWLRDRRHWERFPTELRKQLPESELLMPDIPGNGELCREKSPNDIAGMVKAIRSNLALGANQEQDSCSGQILLVGLSLGGMIATQWAYSYPEEIAGLVLINSSMKPYARPWQRLRPQVWPQILSHLTSPIEEREKLIQSITLNTPYQTEHRWKQWVAWSKAKPVSFLNAQRQLHAAVRFKSPFKKKPSLPTLVISGERDQLVNPICSTKLANSWQCSHETHPQAGHDLPVEQPFWLAHTISQWVNHL